VQLERVLGIPLDVLRLSSGQFPPDVDPLVATRTFEITASIRQEVENQALLLPTHLPADFVHLLQPSTTQPLSVARAPFEGSLRAGKNTTAYRAHSYHTKVPPEAIATVLNHYTAPGAVVLDPFCGSGMTGVAAIRAGRHAILSDLSPAAVHIARNYTTPCSPVELERAFTRVAQAVEPLMEWLYQVPGPDGRAAQVEHTTWSDIFECPACTKELVYWDAARNRETGAVEDQVRCPYCQGTFEKRDLTWVGERPVETNLSVAGIRTRQVHPPTAAEMDLIARANAKPIPYWIPKVPFDSSREMWRAAHKASGINSVADFYTRRNLLALAALRHAILMEEPDVRLRDALLFAFTAMVNRASKRYQWNVKRPTNVMTGTLYVSSLRYEWNVWSLFQRKVRDVVRYYQHLGQPEGRAATLLASATRLEHIPASSIDFVFTDPPFGSNIFYADSSLLWDAWLGRLTDHSEEMVVNVHRTPSSGGKRLEDYGRLMTAAFSEMRRVLKPSGYAVLVFNNTNDQVWVTLQDAIRDAGFEVAAASGLDKVHASIKGVKGRQQLEEVASYDAVISLRARSGVQRARRQSTSEMVRTLAEGYLQEIAPRTAATDELFAAVVRRLLEQHVSVAGVTMQSVRTACAGLVQTEDGMWRLPDGAAKLLYVPVDSPYGCLATQYVGDPGVLVAEAEKRAPKAVGPFEQELVEGTRNTELYNAHSYHTKVPPEAIIPFLEHYTRPGDVVLDPFSGSGMTGVAASLTGRKAILNDLSVAAAHLGYNHTRPCDHQKLLLGFGELYERLRPEFEQLYETRDENGVQGYVLYTLWSRDARCPKCHGLFSMWDVIDRKTGRMGTTITCVHCQAIFPKQGLKYEGNRPVLISYETRAGKRHERAPTSWDLQHIGAFRRDTITDWYPEVPLGPDREMYIRSALHLQQVSSVADFYTARNLRALALLWREINTEKDLRVRHALAFAFTNTAWHGTRMRRFNARGGQRPLTGTLYIPQLSSEANVLEVMRNKVKQLAAFYRSYRPNTEPLPVISLGSATALSVVPEGTVDYVFTDPPFGSNIFYADCNLIWESWLGGITASKTEAVVNRSLPMEQGGKSVADYEQLMTQALREMHRVLKPGGWVTLVFHNTDPAVWRALQVASTEAGFEIETAAGLDRKQQSHKGYKGRAGDEDVAHFDVVLSMRKSKRTSVRPRPAADNKAITELLREILRAAPGEKGNVQFLHSALLRKLAERGFDLGSVSYERVRELSEKSGGLKRAR
jgi:DNA modification methylase